MSKARDIADIGDGSGLTGIVIPPIHDPVAVTGATPSLDVGSYNYFNQGDITADTTLTFASVPTNANWRYTFSTTIVDGLWDVTTSSLSASLSVTAQESSPQGMFFKPDGTKMYVTGSTGDDVNEYDLSTAWDVTTATFLQSFSVAGQDTSPYEVFFSSDGIYMYMTGGIVKHLHQYTLSTAWDISTASFTRSFDSTATTATPQGVYFTSDGLSLYMVDSAGDEVNQYSLSTAWNISTITWVRLFSVSAQEALPLCVHFKPDGTKMYVGGATTDSINEYTLSTAWDISTATYLQAFSTAAQEVNPHGVFFKPDGSKMYVTGNASVAVTEYNVGTSAILTLPAALQNTPPTPLIIGKTITYEFLTDDAGVTVTLISEEIV